MNIQILDEAQADLHEGAEFYDGKMRGWEPTFSTQFFQILTH
jgi:hypothetical protein